MACRTCVLFTSLVQQQYSWSSTAHVIRSTCQSQPAPQQKPRHQLLPLLCANRLSRAPAAVRTCTHTKTRMQPRLLDKVLAVLAVQLGCCCSAYATATPSAHTAASAAATCACPASAAGAGKVMPLVQTQLNWPYADHCAHASTTVPFDITAVNAVVPVRTQWDSSLLLLLLPPG
mgnify:CR=1 FL=1